MTDAEDLGCAKHDAYIIGCPLCMRAWLDRPCPPKPESEPPELGAEPEPGAPFDELLPPVVGDT